MDDISRDPMDILLERRISRRRLIQTGSAFVAASAAGGGLMAFLDACGGGQTATSTGGAGMHPADDLVVQVFPTELAATSKALSTYQSQYGKSATAITVPSDYYTVSETRFISGKPPFNSLDQDPGYMTKYYHNKWIVDFEGLPGVDDLKKDLFPSVLKACTAPDGKLAALPYYTNTIAFFYNEALLSAHGMKPASDWDEMYNQALQLKQGGIDSPIVPVWTTKYDLTYYTFVNECISRGLLSMFDAKLNPVWDSNPIARSVLDYWRKLQDAKVVPVDSLTIDHHQASSVMQAGKGVYFIFNSYELKNLNKAQTSKEAGHIRIGAMPGSTHKALTQTSVLYQSKRSPREQAWPLTSFKGGYDKNGKLTGPIQIAAIGLGLSPGYKSIAKDSEVTTAWANWSTPQDLDNLSKQSTASVDEGDVLNQAWYSDYTDFMTKTLSQYLARQIAADVALKQTADFVRSKKQ